MPQGPLSRCICWRGHGVIMHLRSCTLSHTPYTILYRSGIHDALGEASSFSAGPAVLTPRAEFQLRHLKTATAACVSAEVVHHPIA